jgi:hypothetical protein
MAPALVLPYYDLNGDPVLFPGVTGPTRYAAYRFDPPLRTKDGKERKYLVPAREPHHLYVPQLAVCRAAVARRGATLGIVEGIFKALASCQAGFPCLGMMGPWGWTRGREGDGDGRLAVAELEAIDWCGRLVPLFPDTDPTRKPAVHLGFCELARWLTDRGARVRILRLPPGPRGDDGLPLKQALDDFLVRHGPAAFRRWLEGQLAAPHPRELDAWREEMVERRRAAFLTEQAFRDASPTGAGKSYADAEALARGVEINVCKAEGVAVRYRPASLSLVPTHVQAAEDVAVCTAKGLDAAAYPPLNEDTCMRYEEAQVVQLGRGLSFRLALCPDCKHKDECEYNQQTARADAAPHAVATHARGALALPAMLHRGPVRRRRLLLVHEAPADLLRPVQGAAGGFLDVREVAVIAGDAATDADARAFCEHLAANAKWLDGELNGSNEPALLEVPTAARAPAKMYEQLNAACMRLDAHGYADAMRLALAATLGQLDYLAVQVDERPRPRPGGPDGTGVRVKVYRTLLGGLKHDLPAEVTILLADATGDPEVLEAAGHGRPLHDLTPAGQLPRLRDALHIIPDRDVTKARKPKAVLPQLRGVMYDLPHRRVGLITHYELADALPDLIEDSYKSRLVMASYFGGGLTRGTNVWPDACDALLVFGSPRVGAGAVRQHLLRLGKFRAAVLRPAVVNGKKVVAGWGPDWWSGVTASGKRQTVRCWHYADPDWHAAYCALVWAELWQAVGRARAILPTGIPVYVVSTEMLAPPSDGCDGYRGLPLAEPGRYSPLTEAQARVLGAMRNERGVRVPRTTTEVARALGISWPTADRHLRQLVEAGRVRRAGKRWVAAPCPGPKT